MSCDKSITVRRMDQSDRSEVLKLQLQKHQHAYVSPISNILSKLENNPYKYPYLIYNNNQLIGYVQINTNWDDIAHYSENKSTLGLEGFFLDFHVQGQGLGIPSIIAVLCKLKDDYPNYEQVALTVNCRNKAAIQTYLKGGFQDTGRLYHGGRSGPQHILSYKSE